MPLKRRERCQIRECWPFLYSVDDRGIVRNVSAKVEDQPAPQPEPVVKKKRGAAGRRKAWWNKDNKVSPK
jgi:hypothetical protein